MSDSKNRDPQSKQVFMDDLQSLRGVLQDQDADNIPTLSDVVHYGNVALQNEPDANPATAQRSMEAIDEQLNANLQSVQLETSDDIPVLTDVAQASTHSEHSLDELLAQAPRFELLDGGRSSGVNLQDGDVTPPVREKITNREELIEQLDHEAHRLLDEIITRHTPLIREELIARLDDVKQTLLEELKQSID